MALIRIRNVFHFTSNVMEINKICYVNIWWNNEWFIIDHANTHFIQDKHTSIHWWLKIEDAADNNNNGNKKKIEIESENGKPIKNYSLMHNAQCTNIERWKAVLLLIFQGSFLTIILIYDFMLNAIASCSIVSNSLMLSTSVNVWNWAVMTMGTATNRLTSND